MGSPRIELQPQHTAAELRHHYQTCTNAVEKRRTQLIWHLLDGIGLEDAKELTAYSHPAALDAIKRYNQAGLPGLKDQRVHNHSGTALLSDPEMLLLAQSIRSDYQRGVVWRAGDVVRWLSERLGRPVHFQRGYELLKAVGFTLQSPRPSHIDSDPALMEEFKKNSA